MNRRKWIYIGVLIVVAAIVSIASFSYAFLTRIDEQHGKINIVAGTLDYKIESDDLSNNSITLSANESKEIEITIKSVNKINSKYQLYTNNVENVDIRYTDEEEPGVGTISSNGTKTIKVVLENNSDTDKTITFGVQGGFENKTLTLEDNRVAVVLGDELCKAGKVYNFDYTGNVQEFTTKCSGTYKLETWGAQGTANPAQILSVGGLGGYSAGEMVYGKGRTLKVVVGGTNGYNGGGGITDNTQGQSNGGGATHIALNDSNSYTTLASYVNETNARNYIYLVAAGGGGGGNVPTSTSGGGNGGAGGGTTGMAGSATSSTVSYTWSKRAGQGGTQTAGGAYGLCYSGTGQCGMTGTFGQGGGIYNCNTSECLPASQAGGGGGWYGGGSARHSGGGGGSSFISGVYNGKTIAGNASMPTHDGTSTMIGNSGNGYARITYLGTRTVTFNANGGELSENSRKVNYGYAVGELPTPTKSGKIFDGWYLDSNFTTKVDSTYVVENNITLYARYGTEVNMNLSGRTKGSPTIISGKNATFNTNTYLVGYNGGGYWQENKVSSPSYTASRISVKSDYAGYGIAMPMVLNTGKYKYIWTNQNGNPIVNGCYDRNGTYLNAKYIYNQHGGYFEVTDDIYYVVATVASHSQGQSEVVTNLHLYKLD